MTTITPVRSPADWRADQIGPGWIHPLDRASRAEVLAAVAGADNVALADVSRGTFPLPGLGPTLERLAAEVVDGPGFVVVRGAPVAGLTERQGELVALGIASYLGRIVGQGPTHELLLHVRDQGVDPALPTTRSYQHNQRLGFHADPTDIVALLCLRPARSGGLSTIVSSVAVHNELVRSAPELAEVLYQPWWRDRRTGDGADSFFQRPVYAVDAAGRLVADYGPDYMRSAQRGAQVPPLSPTQRAAMDALDRLHLDPRFVLSMDLRAGDMQFLNNAVILHSRTSYVDHADPQLRRDLIRLWLDVPTGRPAGGRNGPTR